MSLPYQTDGSVEVALAQPGYFLALPVILNALFPEPGLHSFHVIARNVNALHAAVDGRQNSPGIVGGHDEHRVGERLLDKLQHFVGGVLVHSFRLPQQGDLVF